MNKMIFDILGKLHEEGITKKYPFIGASAMLSNNDITYYQLPSIDRDIYIYIPIN